ncbi:MAG: hypothetical protein H0V29_09075 [Thermoleophilaceae bacterium]|nr:hypothetical protein [Thermoleophilaceae bacterium]
MNGKITVTNLRKEARRRLIRSPAKVRHHEPSVVMSADDDPARPSEALIDLALEAVRLAKDADLREVSDRIGSGPATRISGPASTTSCSSASFVRSRQGRALRLAGAIVATHGVYGAGFAQGLAGARPPSAEGQS